MMFSVGIGYSQLAGSDCPVGFRLIADREQLNQ
jgi:hypothetical protein